MKVADNISRKTLECEWVKALKGKSSLVADSRLAHACYWSYYTVRVRNR